MANFNFRGRVMITPRFDSSAKDPVHPAASAGAGVAPVVVTSSEEECHVYFTCHGCGKASVFTEVRTREAGQEEVEVQYRLLRPQRQGRTLP